MENKDKNQNYRTYKNGTKQENGTVLKRSIYEEFIAWVAMPPTERAKTGLNTQTQFVEHFGINKNTPTMWKTRKDFTAQVTELRRQWGFDKTSEVMEGIYKAALNGNPSSQKLWLQHFVGFTEKTTLENKDNIVISVNDIRYLIEGLSEPQRTKHFDNLRELLDDSTEAKNAGLLDDSPRIEIEENYELSLLEKNELPPISVSTLHRANVTVCDISAYSYKTSR